MSTGTKPRQEAELRSETPSFSRLSHVKRRVTMESIGQGCANGRCPKHAGFKRRLKTNIETPQGNSNQNGEQQSRWTLAWSRPSQQTPKTRNSPEKIDGSYLLQRRRRAKEQITMHNTPNKIQNFVVASQKISGLTIAMTTKAKSAVASTVTNRVGSNPPRCSKYLGVDVEGQNHIAKRKRKK